MRRGRGRGAGVAAANAATKAAAFVSPRSFGVGGGVPPVRRRCFRHGGEDGVVVGGSTAAIVAQAKAAALRGGYASSLVAEGRAHFVMPESGWETRECCRAEHQATGRDGGEGGEKKGAREPRSGHDRSGKVCRVFGQTTKIPKY